MSTTSYTQADLDSLKRALASGTRRVQFGDRSVEYASVDDLKKAISTVQAALDAQAGNKPVRQILLYSDGGF